MLSNSRPLLIFTGSNVTYKVQGEGKVMASSSAAMGIFPHNITLGPEVINASGPGCHLLNLLATNNVTAADAITELEVCVLEPVHGLQAAVSTQAGLCPEAYVHVTVSLDQGAPAQLLFQISGGDNDTVQEEREVYNGGLQVFNISTKIKGVHACEMYFFIAMYGII